MNENKDKKSSSKEIITAILTIAIMILILGIYIGIIYALVEQVPIPAGFDDKWTWYFTDPFTNIKACPWGFKILIFGALMCCFIVGLTISIYIWKKGKIWLYKMLYGDKNE